MSTGPGVIGTVRPRSRPWAMRTSMRRQRCATGPSQLTSRARVVVAATVGPPSASPCAVGRTSPGHIRTRPSAVAAASAPRRRRARGPTSCPAVHRRGEPGARRGARGVQRARALRSRSSLHSAGSMRSSTSRRPSGVRASITLGSPGRNRAPALRRLRRWSPRSPARARTAPPRAAERPRLRADVRRRGASRRSSITARRWERLRRRSRARLHRSRIWGVPGGLIGGRLYFLATSWNEVPDHWWGPFAVWEGGLGIWGGIAARHARSASGVLRRARRPTSRASWTPRRPALLVAQSIGRVGNWFNQELFGGPTTCPWGLEIDPAHRPGRLRRTTPPSTRPSSTRSSGTSAWPPSSSGSATTARIRPPGLFALYVTGYSAFRIFEELLRVDPAHHILGLRLNFFVAAVLTIAGAAWFLRTQRTNRPPDPRPSDAAPERSP